MFDLKGIMPPMVTPFDETGAIRYDAFERNIENYVTAGIEGYLVLGSKARAARSQPPSTSLRHRESLTHPLLPGRFVALDGTLRVSAVEAALQRMCLSWSRSQPIGSLGIL